jgi:hypothetical protein
VDRSGGKGGFGVKVMAECKTCTREFQLDMLLEGPVITGACPWCGALLSRDYAALLPDLIRPLERDGEGFVRALRRLSAPWLGSQMLPGRC